MVDIDASEQMVGTIDLEYYERVVHAFTVAAEAVLGAERVQIGLVDESGDGSADGGLPEARARTLALRDGAARPWGSVRIERSDPWTEREDDVAGELVALLARVLTSPRPSDISSGVADAVAQCIEDTLTGLDEMTMSAMTSRLEFVARSVCECVDGTGWWVGRVEGEALVTVSQRASPSCPGPGVMGTAFARGPLRPAPLQRAVEGGSFLSTWEGRDGISETLAFYGLKAVVGAGGYDIDAGQWLVCVSSDGTGHPLGEGRPALTAGVQAALGFPRAPRFHLTG